ncbi:MAG TPA: hypothetical protein VNR40_21305 [Steroidobacter sp.]|nr:hypothetical protein [Steroidobacter sp.]
MLLDLADFEQLANLASHAGISPTACAKNIVLDVLHDDAAAHQSAEEFANA